MQDHWFPESPYNDFHLTICDKLGAMTVADPEDALSELTTLFPNHPINDTDEPWSLFESITTANGDSSATHPRVEDLSVSLEPPLSPLRTPFLAHAHSHLSSESSAISIQSSFPSPFDCRSPFSSKWPRKWDERRPPTSTSPIIIRGPLNPDHRQRQLFRIPEFSPPMNPLAHNSHESSFAELPLSHNVPEITPLSLQTYTAQNQLPAHDGHMLKPKLRDRPGLLRNLPHFTVPISPPFSLSPVAPSSPLSPTCLLTPLKSPFLIRTKDDSKLRKDGSYFALCSS